MTQSQVIASWPGIPFLTVEPRIPFRRGDGYYSEFLPPEGRDAYNSGSHPCPPMQTSLVQKSVQLSFKTVLYPASSPLVTLFLNSRLNCILFSCAIHDLPCALVHTVSFSLSESFHLTLNPFCPQRLPEFCHLQKTFYDSPNWNLSFPFVYLDPYSHCTVFSVPFLIS